MATKQPNWLRMDQPPPDCKFARLLPLNSHEFIIVPQISIKKYKNQDGIYKYNSIIKQWIKIMDYPKDFKSYAHHATIVKNANIIYIINSTATLFKINLISKSMESKHFDMNLGQYPGILFVNDDIHIVGGKESSKHFILNQNNEPKKFKQLHDFKVYPHLIPIFFHRTQSMIAVVPSIGPNHASMMKYKNGIWKNLNLSSDYYFYFRRVAVTKAQDYMIFISAYNHKKLQLEHVLFVYDLKNGTVIKSDIKAPTIKSTTAITTRNIERDGLLTFGFVNYCYKLKEFDGVQDLPFYIIKLIEKWVCFEIMHIIELTLSRKDITTKHHWTINVDTIIQSALTRM